MKFPDLIKEPEPIIFSKRRSLAVFITEEAKIIIKAPKNLNQNKIQNFIDQKTNWINKKIKAKTEQLEKLKDRKIENDKKIPFLGKELTIKTNSEKNSIDHDKNTINLKFQHLEEDTKEQVIKLYKKQAKKIFEDRITIWSLKMNLKPSKIRLSSAKTRWGSCTGKNVISLNWKLLLAPLEILDYVVIHELAHIEQKNHSKKFWSLVEKFDPSWKNKRKWLKENGISLKI